jgi:hypothetical protein
MIDALPQFLYDRTHDALERCRNGFKPTEELFEEFGEKAPQPLLRDGRLLDDSEIQPPLNIKLDGRSFRTHTDRTEPPKLRLVA